MPLSQFSDRTRAWFEGAFEAPTPAQEQAWPAIATGEDAAIAAAADIGYRPSAGIRPSALWRSMRSRSAGLISNSASVAIATCGDQNG